MFWEQCSFSKSILFILYNHHHLSLDLSAKTQASEITLMLVNFLPVWYVVVHSLWCWESFWDFVRPLLNGQIPSLIARSVWTFPSRMTGLGGWGGPRGSQRGGGICSHHLRWTAARWVGQRISGSISQFNSHIGLDFSWLFQL